MGGLRLGLGLLLLLGACELDTGGVGGMSSSTAADTDVRTTEDSSDIMASGQQTDAATMAGSGAETDPDSGGSGTATIGESTTGPETPSESSGSGSSSGEPPISGPYGPCMDGACQDDQQCYEAERHSLCMPPCPGGDTRECPAPDGGTASEICIGARPINLHCMIECSRATTCPTGMDCVELDVGITIYRCMWPD